MKPATYIDEFLEPYTWKGSKRTYQNYRDALRQLESWCHDIGIQTIEASSSDVISWLTHEATRETRLGHPQAPSTIRLLHNTATLFYEWCLRQGFVTENPLEHVPRPKDSFLVKQPYTKDEISALITAAADSVNAFARTRNVALLLMLLGTGARAAEVIAVNIDEALSAADTIEPKPLILHGKGARDRYVPLGENTRTALNLWIGQRGTRPGALFRTVRNNDMAYPALYATLQRLGEIARVKCEPHRFRHTFAAEYYKRHLDARALQMMMGHSTLDTTEIYLRSLGLDWATAKGYEMPDVWLTPELL